MHSLVKKLSLVTLSYLLSIAGAHADGGACSAASLVNPYNLEGGISGTGLPANGGVAGTGSPVAAGGVAGTGAPVLAKGGVSGTGAPVLAKGGISGTGAAVLEKGGVSGTGSPVAAGGLGGTGAPLAKGGIGGTGDQVPAYALLPQDDYQGGIAIMGVVTGFASICVNGEEVQYESSTPIYDNGKTAKLADLAVGKTVMLKVDRVAGNLHARAIGLFNAVTGPVSNVDMARRQINVMGQTVQVNEAIVRQLSATKAGAVASVSGYRLDNGAVVASRVDLVAADTSANTLGLVTRVAPDGFVVNGTKVSVDNRQALQKINVGSEVQVSGHWSEGKLKANHIEVQPINNIVNRMDSAILEGYVRKDAQNNLSIAGTEVKSAQTEALSKQLERFKDKLVKIELRRDNKGKWIADKIEGRSAKLLENDMQFKENSGNENDSSSAKREGGQDDSGSGSSRGSDDSLSGSGSSDSSGSGRDFSDTDRDSSGSGRDSSGAGRDSAGSGRDSSASGRLDSGSGGGDRSSGKNK